jgi:hypothetical protein
MESGDAVIFGLMGTAVGFMSLCLLGLLVWSLIERPTDDLVRVAAIGGLVLVTTGFRPASLSPPTGSPRRR